MVSDEVSPHFGDVLVLRRGVYVILQCLDFRTKLNGAIQVRDGSRTIFVLQLEDAAGFSR